MNVEYHLYLFIYSFYIGYSLIIEYLCSIIFYRKIGLLIIVTSWITKMIYFFIIFIIVVILSITPISTLFITIWIIKLKFTNILLTFLFNTVRRVTFSIHERTITIKMLSLLEWILAFVFFCTCQRFVVASFSRNITFFFFLVLTLVIP